MRAVVMEAVGVHVPVLGSYNSALAVALPEASTPPVTRIFPLFSRVATERNRAVFMLPVAVHVPGACDVASWRTIPVTGLLNAAKVSRTPTEQRKKPIKTRGLKKADREVGFVFIVVISLVCLVLRR